MVQYYAVFGAIKTNFQGSCTRVERILIFNTCTFFCYELNIYKKEV